MSSGTIELDVVDLGLAAALVLAVAGVSLALQLGLGPRVFVASVRAVAQLSLLGLLLRWIFELGSPWAVCAVFLVMGTFAGTEAVRATTRRVRGVYAVSIGVMLFSSAVVTLYGVVVVVGVEPWWRPQYVVPILGMVLGNTLNGISLGLESALEGFTRDARRVEVLLAHGATRREASREVVRRGVRTGLIPTLNMMVAAGVVSIPGMMTGQILAGESPAAAARYQVFILFLIAGGVALGTVAMVHLASRLVFDDRDRLRGDWIESR